MNVIEFSSEHFLCELILKMTNHGLFYDGKPSLWRRHHLGGILSMSFAQKMPPSKYAIFLTISGSLKMFPLSMIPSKKYHATNFKKYPTEQYKSLMSCSKGAPNTTRSN